MVSQIVLSAISLGIGIFLYSLLLQFSMLCDLSLQFVEFVVGFVVFVVGKGLKFADLIDKMDIVLDLSQNLSDFVGKLLGFCFQKGLVMLDEECQFLG